MPWSSLMLSVFFETLDIRDFVSSCTLYKNLCVVSISLVDVPLSVCDSSKPLSLLTILQTDGLLCVCTYLDNLVLSGEPSPVCMGAYLLLLKLCVLNPMHLPLRHDCSQSI